VSVGDLADCCPCKLARLHNLVKTLSATSMAAAVYAASRALPGVYHAQVTDHRLADNPYESKYGPFEWEAKIADAPLLKNSVCVKDLITHIMVASQEVFIGSKFADPTSENHWMFYHDALSTMTCAKTIVWMHEKDYYRFWLLPKGGLNDGTRYACRPVGNSPEMMPWDASLNKDVDDSFQFHVALTKNLLPTDPPQALRLHDAAT